MLARAQPVAGGVGSPVTSRAFWVEPGEGPVVAAERIDGPAVVPAGGVLRVGYALVNSGAGWARGGVTDAVELRPLDASSGATPATVGSTVRRGALGPGETLATTLAAVRLPTELVEGRYELVVTPGGRGGQVRTQALRVSAATHPDLAVAKFEAPPTVVVGEPFPVRFVVENRSPVTAAGLWGDRVFWSADERLDANDVQLLSEPRVKDLPGFDAYGSPVHSGVVGSEVTTGPGFLILVTDATQELDEGAFEDNNARVRPVTVMGAPDVEEESELTLGREDEPADRVSVAWIAYDDFQDLQARRSVTYQPAIQAELTPVPDAPLRSDAATDREGPARDGEAVDAPAVPPAPPALAAVAAAEPEAKVGPTDAGGSAEGVTEPAEEEQPPAEAETPTETPAPPAAPPSAPSVAATSPTPTPEPRPTATPRSDREADPTAPIEATVRPGGVLVERGLEVKTFRPRFSVTARTLSFPRNPEVTLIFGRDGVVQEAVLKTSTGFDNVDGPLLSSLYRWTATGPRLTASDVPVRLELTILLGAPTRAQRDAERKEAEGKGEKGNKGDEAGE